MGKTSHRPALRLFPPHCTDAALLVPSVIGEGPIGDDEAFGDNDQVLGDYSYETVLDPSSSECVRHMRAVGQRNWDSHVAFALSVFHSHTPTAFQSNCALSRLKLCSHPIFV